MPQLGIAMAELKITFTIDLNFNLLRQLKARLMTADQNKSSSTYKLFNLNNLSQQIFSILKMMYFNCQQLIPRSNQFFHTSSIQRKVSSEGSIASKLWRGAIKSSLSILKSVQVLVTVDTSEYLECPYHAKISSFVPRLWTHHSKEGRGHWKFCDLMLMCRMAS